jgi:hypothetical protein
MAKFRVSQTVMCEVKVWYVVDTIDHASAIAEVAGNASPTTVSGSDYEIVSDHAIAFTMVEAI